MIQHSDRVSRMLAGATIIAGLTLTSAAPATAQQSALQKQLVGTWTLVSNTLTRPDGSKYLPFGPDGQGSLMFDSAGRYSLQICRTGRAKFASNNREKGTPAEYEATVHGCNPHWGRYTVSDADRVITFHIDHAMFPNWEGIEQKRTFVLSGDELKYVVPAASAGGTSEVVWRRAR